MSNKITNTFKAICADKKKLAGIGAVMAIVLVSVVLNSTASNNDVKARTYAKVKSTELTNKDASYKVGGRPDEMLALNKEEEKIKAENTSKSNGAYIPATFDYDLNNTVIEAKAPKEKKLTDSNPIFNIPREEEKKPAIERTSVDKRGREVNQKEAAAVQSRKTEFSNEELAKIWTVANSYNAATGAKVSNQSIGEAQMKELLEKANKKPGVEVSEDFRIVPGSTFYGTLLTPISSIFTEAKVVVKLTSGDLNGWIGVGQANLKSLGSGMVMQITKITSPEGKTQNVDGLVFSDVTGSPGFKDDIDHYLFQRIGYSILGDMSEAVGDTLGTRLEAKNQGKTYGLNKNVTSNSGGPICLEYQNIGGSAVCTRYGTTGADPNKRVQTNDETIYDNSVVDAAKNAALAKGAKTTGSMLGQVFSDMADGYKTEVKVNPQSVLVVFY